MILSDVAIFNSWYFFQLTFLVIFLSLREQIYNLNRQIYEQNRTAFDPPLLIPHATVNHSHQEGSLSKYLTINQGCFCDVSTFCDQQCCCDSDCSAAAKTYWSDYGLCANDGFNIPFCSSVINTPLHIHDLS